MGTPKVKVHFDGGPYVMGHSDGDTLCKGAHRMLGGLLMQKQVGNLIGTTDVRWYSNGGN